MHLAASGVGQGLSRRELTRLAARADLVRLPPGASATIGADRFTYVLAACRLAISSPAGAPAMIGPGETITHGEGVSMLALSEAHILVM